MFAWQAEKIGKEAKNAVRHFYNHVYNTKFASVRHWFRASYLIQFLDFSQFLNVISSKTVLI